MPVRNKPRKSGPTKTPGIPARFLPQETPNDVGSGGAVLTGPPGVDVYNPKPGDEATMAPDYRGLKSPSSRTLRMLDEENAGGKVFESRLGEQPDCFRELVAMAFRGCSPTARETCSKICIVVLMAFVVSQAMFLAYIIHGAFFVSSGTNVWLNPNLFTRDGHLKVIDVDAQHFDLNKDGRVTPDELVMVAKHLEDTKRAAYPDVAKILDADADGVISEKELKHAIMLMANQREKENQEEVPPLPPPPGGGVAASPAPSSAPSYPGMPPPPPPGVPIVVQPPPPPPPPPPVVEAPAGQEPPAGSGKHAGAPPPPPVEFVAPPAEVFPTPVVPPAGSAPVAEVPPPAFAAPRVVPPAWSVPAVVEPPSQPAVGEGSSPPLQSLPSPASPPQGVVAKEPMQAASDPDGSPGDVVTSNQMSREALQQAPLPNSIKIRVVAGLGNRLRQMLGAYYYAHYVVERPLHVVWTKDAFCSAHFLELFEPLADDVTFAISGMAKPAHRGGFNLVIEAYMLQTPTMMPWGWTTYYDPKAPNVKRFKPPKGVSWSNLSSQMYALLKPAKPLAVAIDAFTEENGIRENAVAVHVRRTDQESKVNGRPNIVTSTDQFFEWIDLRSETVHARSGRVPKIFLATDNPTSRKEFADRYGDRVAVYGEIKESKSIRLTSVEQAVCDAFIASRALEFKGTAGTERGSSFSAMILQFWRGQHVGRKICSPSKLDTACHQ